jgi:hypothetical protein
MGIVPKDDPDHMARVIDVYKYWYSPKTAQMMYEETLANGNFVQGPPAIKGVTMSEENQAKLSGFIADGNVRSEMLGFIGSVLQADNPAFTANELAFTNGEVTVEKYLELVNKLSMKKLDDDIKKSGEDLNPATKDTPQQ